MTIIYQKLNKSHIKGLVDLHKKSATEKNILPLFGDKAIEKFYEWWIDKEDVIAFVAVFNGEVIGHILGPLKVNYRSDLNKFLFPYLVKGFFLAFFKKPLKLLKLIFKRFSFVILSIKLLFFRNKSKIENIEFEKYGILLSIDVDVNFQGKGVAQELNKMFLSEAKAKGNKKVTLSVRDSNLRAIKFYEKTGWKIYKIEKGARYYYIEL